MNHIFELPDHWDEATDIAVIGSGFAGLSAAIKAAEAGARVIIIEKMSHYGGNSLISGGGCCSYDSRLHLRQKLGLGDDSWQLHMDDTIKGGDNKSIPELVEIMVKHAPDAIDLFLKVGVEFADTLPRLGGHSAHRSYLTIGNKGIIMTEPLLKSAIDAGAILRLNTAVTRIWRAGPDSPVEGIEIKTVDSIKELRVRQAIIIASGGFSQDVEFRKKYNPNLTEAYNCSNHKGATGECIRFAQSIGADVIHMKYIQLFPTANPNTGGLDKQALDAYSSTGFGSVCVDKNGRRFVNELGRRDEVSDAQILGLKDKPTYTILNKKIFDALAVSDIDIQAGIKSGRITSAETVSELAEKLNMAELTDTINKHNRYLETGIDPEFNKEISKFMVPMTQGPFYAISQWPTIHFCMGGLRFDKEAHVIDTSGNIIPRLYAAGECCGGIHGANRLAGNAITECIVFGTIAGFNASKETAND